MSRARGGLWPTMEEVYPEYLTTWSILVCPSGDHRIYVYLGYAVTNESEARVFIDAHRQHAKAGGDFKEDLTVAAGKGTGGTDRIMRLREGVDRDLPIGESKNPIMFDSSLDNHVPPGINVLYMDGHVEFVREGEFPAQRWFLDTLAEWGGR